jgi:hypothetical protein
MINPALLPQHSKYIIKIRFDNLENAVKYSSYKDDYWYNRAWCRISALCAIIEVLENCDLITPLERNYMYDQIDTLSRQLPYKLEGEQ